MADSSLFSFAELEHLRWLSVYGGGDELADANCWKDAKPALAALLEVLDAAHGIYGVPKTFLSGHGEADEVTCRCGWQSKAEDYDKARKGLRDHINREEKKILANAAARHKRLDEALARFAVAE